MTLLPSERILRNVNKKSKTERAIRMGTTAAEHLHALESPIWASSNGTMVEIFWESRPKLSNWEDEIYSKAFLDRYKELYKEDNNVPKKKLKKVTIDFLFEEEYNEEEDYTELTLAKIVPKKNELEEHQRTYVAEHFAQSDRFLTETVADIIEAFDGTITTYETEE